MSLCKIYDNVFDAQYLNELYLILDSELKYNPSNTANRKSYPYGHTGSHKLFGHNLLVRRGINNISYFDNQYGKNFISLFYFLCNLKKIDPNKTYLDRISVNLQHSGCNGTLHRDGKLEDKAYTFMIFANPIWKKKWGGQFSIWSDDESEMLEEVEYKAGRVVIFPAHLPHKGLGAKSKYPYVYRYSIVFGVRPLSA